MKIVQFREYGDAGVLELVDGPEPAPGAGEIRVRAEALAAASALTIATIALSRRRIDGI